MISALLFFVLFVKFNGFFSAFLLKKHRLLFRNMNSIKKSYFYDEKARWETYTGTKLSDEDVYEIQRNMQAFAKVLFQWRDELRMKGEKL